jgi:predicted dehydrogenase
MRPINVAVFGAGANTRSRHIPGLRAQERVNVVGVCNRSRASSENAAKELNIGKVYGTYRELVADGDVDAVMIGTWPYMHAPVTIAALNAGKHVLCEARMAMDAAEAHAMLAASRANPQLVAQIVPSPFTFRVDKTIQRLIAAGTLGEILVVELRGGGGFIDRQAPLSWRQNMDYSGLNIMGMGIWYEALMRWTGHAVGVTAVAKTFQKMRKDEAGVMRAIRVPDHVDILADLACGAQLHMQFSAVTGLAGPTEIFVFGSEATLKLSGDKLFMGRRSDTELKEVAVRPEDQGKWRVEEEFINAIRGIEPVTHTTFEDGVKYMEFTEAVSRSARTGSRVTLPL